MIRTAMLALASALLAGCASAPPAPPSDAAVEAALAQSRAAAASLGPELIGALTSAMAEGGPMKAIGVCNEKAPAIANRISTERGVEIGRTSTRVRNPANAADAWETAQLAAFATAIAAGADPATLEGHTVVASEAGWEVRWMKPILLQPMCATCHGADIDPALLQTIRATYTNDAATGFRPGDLRGAFTATVRLRAG